MIKKNLDTKKLYYGFPIFVLGYKDEVFGFNYTTCSSSYTLDNQLVIGLSSESNAAAQISTFRCFTFNLVTRDYLKQTEIGGLSKIDKFNVPGAFHYETSKLIDAPIIQESCISFECQVENILEVEGISHVFATILRRTVNDTLIKNGQLFAENLNPVLFMGDSSKRIYRYLSN